MASQYPNMVPQNYVVPQRGATTVPVMAYPPQYYYPQNQQMPSPQYYYPQNQQTHMVPPPPPEKKGVMEKVFDFFMDNIGFIIFIAIIYMVYSFFGDGLLGGIFGSVKDLLGGGFGLIKDLGGGLVGGISNVGGGLIGGIGGSLGL